MTILITGANRGIGRGLADYYRNQGRGVIATARDNSADVQLDVADPTSHRAMAQHLMGQPVDLLICNAGVYLDKNDTLGDGFEASIWAETFAVNVTGVFLTIETLLPSLRLSPAAKIAIIGSNMGSDARAPGGSYVYRASKAAVLNLGRNLAKDLHSDGIAVGVYHPGWVRTEMGGQEADIDLAPAVQGLAAQFDALSLDSSGIFQSYDGTELPF